MPTKNRHDLGPMPFKKPKTVYRCPWCKTKMNNMLKLNGHIHGCKEAQRSMRRMAASKAPRHIQAG